jgi:cation diffusion facilitator CzcD-associated flavoprotein CzcO
MTEEHVDVLIVGAGISGIGSAYHLKWQCPDKSFLILEELASFGGTWLTHTYPGIRSDSDLYTFGYRFKPWLGPPIATAREILDYMGEVIDESDLQPHIRYHHRIVGADFSRASNLWTVTVEHTETHARSTLTCNFLWMCQGYYRHAEGYTPDWPGAESYRGRFVHPQRWPNDLDLTGKEVLVIGSGATTATLVPAIAEKCAHVTVLQRSPTYFIPGRNLNELVEQLRQIGVDEAWIHEIARKKVLFDQDQFTRRAFDEPESVKGELLAGVQSLLPPNFDMTHFTPRYLPWRQRIAFVPDGDLFAGITTGKASIVTDDIERFTESGVVTKSGVTLKADVIITATGFNMSILGDIPFSVDGKPVDFAETVTYRGMMFTGVPNMVWVFGYFRASWTLRVDLLGDFVCRLLKHMDARGAKRVEMTIPSADKDMKLLPWIDPENFNPGYIMRSMDKLPKRGSKHEWQHTQDYWREKDEIPAIDLDAAEFVYAK